MRTVLAAIASATQTGQDAALCVVVSKQGSGPQVPGSALAVLSDGKTIGTVGGGAVEAEVVRRATDALRNAAEGPRTSSQALGGVLHELSLEGDYGWDDAAICGGRMGVVIARVDARAAGLLVDALEHVERRAPFQLPLFVEREAALVLYRVSIEVPPTLLIAGAGHVGQAVAELAHVVGFHVVVFDDRAELASRERFPTAGERRVGDIAQALATWPLDESCYVVIVTRGHRHDCDALAAVIERPAAYVGMIGSRRKSRTILDQLAQAGAARRNLDRVHTPIGVAIGAVTVPEIAVSIVAELIHARRERTPIPVEGPLPPDTALISH